MNWGNRLLLVFIAFGGLMFYLAYRSYKVNIDLVENDYYKNELKYQDVIDASNRTSLLSRPVMLKLDGNSISVQFPEEMKNTDIKGTAWFYCAADAKKDRHIDLKLNEEAKQQIDIKNFKPGTYVVKFDWTSNNKSYYTERSITIL